MKHLQKLKTLLLFGVLLYTEAMQAQIVYADYSDPDVCQGTEGDYWMTASSFQCVPGLPILHSTDLQHWTLENYAIEKLLLEEHYQKPQHGKGVWAPSIRLHDNTYYIYWGDPDFGIFMVKTDNPRTRWNEPVLVIPGKGLIDPCPLWDEDGRMYLVNGWAASRCGFNSVLTVRELSADGTEAISAPRMVYDGQTDFIGSKTGKGNHTVEGPKFYKRDGYYYILAPAGGVEHGWQIALRSRHIYGPYESKTVCEADGIHQGGWVDDKFLCFQERGAYGRILHLLDVEWRDGWPMMKLRKDKPTAVTYADGLYGKGYTWHANYQHWYGFATPNGGQRIYGCAVEPREGANGRPNLWDVPNLWLRKIDGENSTETLHLRITAKAEGHESGMVVMGRDYCRIGLRYEDGAFTLSQVICREAETKHEDTPIRIAQIPAQNYNAGALDNHECDIWLRVKVERKPTAKAPYNALCTFSYSTDGTKYHTLPTTFPAREGKWIGAKVGAYSLTPSDKSRGWCDLIKQVNK